MKCGGPSKRKLPFLSDCNIWQPTNMLVMYTKEQLKSKTNTALISGITIGKKSMSSRVWTTVVVPLLQCLSLRRNKQLFLLKKKEKEIFQKQNSS